MARRRGPANSPSPAKFRPQGIPDDATLEAMKKDELEETLGMLESRRGSPKGIEGVQQAVDITNAISRVQRRLALVNHEEAVSAHQKAQEALSKWENDVRALEIRIEKMKTAQAKLENQDTVSEMDSGLLEAESVVVAERLNKLSLEKKELEAIARTLEQGGTELAELQGSELKRMNEKETQELDGLKQEYKKRLAELDRWRAGEKERIEQGARDARALLQAEVAKKHASIEKDRGTHKGKEKEFGLKLQRAEGRQGEVRQKDAVLRGNEENRRSDLDAVGEALRDAEAALRDLNENRPPEPGPAPTAPTIEPLAAEAPFPTALDEKIQEEALLAKESLNEFLDSMIMEKPTEGMLLVIKKSLDGSRDVMAKVAAFPNGDEKTRKLGNIKGILNEGSGKKLKEVNQLFDKAIYDVKKLQASSAAASYADEYQDRVTTAHDTLRAEKAFYRELIDWLGKRTGPVPSRPLTAAAPTPAASVAAQIPELVPEEGKDLRADLEPKENEFPPITTGSLKFPDSLSEKLKAGEEINVLAICTGNYNRSPALEIILRHSLSKAGINGSILSRGTLAWVGTGKQRNPHLRQMAEEEGMGNIEDSQYISRKYTREEVLRADIVFVVGVDQKAEIARLVSSEDKVVDLTKTFYDKEGELFDPQDYRDESDEVLKAATAKMFRELKKIVEEGIMPTFLSFLPAAADITDPNLSVLELDLDDTKDGKITGEYPAAGRLASNHLAQWIKSMAGQSVTEATFASADPAWYDELRDIFARGDDEMRAKAAYALRPFARLAPAQVSLDQVYELYELAVVDTNEEVRIRAAETLYALVRLRHPQATKLFIDSLFKSTPPCTPAEIDAVFGSLNTLANELQKIEQAPKASATPLPLSPEDQRHNRNFLTQTLSDILDQAGSADIAKSSPSVVDKVLELYLSYPAALPKYWAPQAPSLTNNIKFFADREGQGHRYVDIFEILARLRSISVDTKGLEALGKKVGTDILNNLDYYLSQAKVQRLKNFLALHPDKDSLEWKMVVDELSKADKPFIKEIIEGAFKAKKEDQIEATVRSMMKDVPFDLGHNEWNVICKIVMFVETALHPEGLIEEIKGKVKDLMTDVKQAKEEGTFESQRARFVQHYEQLKRRLEELKTLQKNNATSLLRDVTEGQFLAQRTGPGKIMGEGLSAKLNDIQGQLERVAKVLEAFHQRASL